MDKKCPIVDCLSNDFFSQYLPKALIFSRKPKFPCLR